MASSLFQKFTMTYNELTEAVEDYLRKVGDLTDSESFIFLDLPVTLNDYGDVDFEAEIVYNKKQ